MSKKLGGIRSFFKKLGPGLITGAADDDPSGIATYSIAGAQSGTSLLWLAWITWPLMGAVQMMCARIGLVTGRGLAGALRKKIPRPVLIVICAALFIANILNVAADLSGMADAASMLTGLPAGIYVILFAISITIATIKLCYADLAGVLKWLTFFLFSYVIASFDSHPHWVQVLHDGFIPNIPKEKETWATIVAVLGTTISPYLFFWQSSQEVEEEKEHGQKTLKQRKGCTQQELNDRAIDVGYGTFISNAVMFFIIVTTAYTLHLHGITKIETSRDAALALKPLAGNFAYLLYTIGILGVGFLAIPTLTGSAAYALAETFAWQQGLDAKFSKARAFYTAIVVSTVIAVFLNFLHINPVQALYWSAVLNGLLAPFLIVLLLLVAMDRKLMENQPSSMLARLVVGITAVLMFGAGVMMFVL
jgi:NRAMP (natural resistance-associated macrophage protein)-like metal ion transporter